MEGARAEVEALMRDSVVPPQDYWAERSALAWN